MNFNSIFVELNKIYDENDRAKVGSNRSAHMATRKRMHESLAETWNSNDQSLNPEVNRAVDPNAKWAPVEWKTLKTGDVFMYDSNDRWFKDGQFIGPQYGEKPYAVTVTEADIEKITDPKTNEPYKKYIEEKGKYKCGNMLADCNGNSIGSDPCYLHSDLTVYKLVEGLTEDDDVEIEIVEDSQLVLECANCGALVIKPEGEVETDESGVANVKEACQFCEEAKGYKVLGTFSPIDSEEAEETEDETEDQEDENLDEGIFNSKKDKPESVDKENLTELFGFGKEKQKGGTSKGGSSADKESSVTISIYDENGTSQFSHTFKEIPGKIRAEEQFNELIKSNGVLRKYKASPKKSDWTYVRKSNPASSFDTDKYRNPASRIIREAIEEPAENLDELFDADVNLSLDGGDNNNVSVLSTESLEELFDADINLSLDGGTGNDVSVL